MTFVAAIVVGPQAPRVPAVVSETIRVASPGALTEAARSANAPQVWLLGSGAEATTAALEALEAAMPVPAASLPVDARGRPHEELLGGFVDGDIAALLDAVSERRVPLRHLPIVSLLVAREDVLALSPPDVRAFGPYAGVEWTARLFATRGGFLIPASTVTLAEAPRFGSPLAASRLVRAGAWRRTDALRPLRLAVNRMLETDI